MSSFRKSGPPASAGAAARAASQASASARARVEYLVRMAHHPRAGPVFVDRAAHQRHERIGPDGLPFGPHPHRGMETVTFILDGDISHKDSSGHESIITSGGVQWMTAGRGLIHAETSSEEFKKNGGPLEILQLWINLPANLKMTEPKYIGKQKAS